ncbi:MAG: MFS transporter [Rhodospirillaceae bacterium]|nr:MFS transporter [Rhodospirillaceae bacterium]
MPDELSAADHSSPDSQPEHKAASVFRDRSFHGLAISQFLGAFNDNLFKQLVLLLCVGRATTEADGGDLQPVAMAVFAVPWLLLSGLAGVLADRTSKRAGIVLFKSLEIAVMTAGLLAFLSGELWPLMIVLFLMSAQSAFFGPPKYGILPELFRARDLPTVNGIFQMTTFLAIIFGMATAGYARDWFPGQSGLAWTSSGSILVAILGTAAALMIRRTPPAQADLQFSWRAAGIDPDNWNLLKTDRFIRGVLLVSALFWFSGAVVQQAVNSFGKRELGLSDTRTSLLAASLGIGIAAGCVIGGQLSKSRIRFGLVRSGSWGLVASLLALVAVSLVRAAGKALVGVPGSLHGRLAELRGILRQPGDRSVALPERRSRPLPQSAADSAPGSGHVGTFEDPARRDRGGSPPPTQPPLRLVRRHRRLHHHTAKRRGPRRHGSLDVECKKGTIPWITSISR